MDDLSPSATCRLTKAAARLSARGRFAEAEEYLLRAAECLRRSGTYPKRAAVWNELGMVCKYLGKFHSAERYYRQALRCAGQLEGQKRNHLIADLFHNLGGVEHSRGRFASGERYARKGLRLRLQFSAAGSHAVASDLAGLAAILYGLGKIDEAEKLYRRALSIYRRHFGANHAEIAVVLNNLGSLFQASGRIESVLHSRLYLSSTVLLNGQTACDVISKSSKVQLRYTHQFFSFAANCSKLRSLNYLRIRSITLKFPVLS